MLNTLFPYVGAELDLFRRGAPHGRAGVQPPAQQDRCFPQRGNRRGHPRAQDTREGKLGFTP